ncbi:hypothetical protein ACN47E_001279 [Coniothyrium glycines]
MLNKTQVDPLHDQNDTARWSRSGYGQSVISHGLQYVVSVKVSVPSKAIRSSSSHRVRRECSSITPRRLFLLSSPQYNVTKQARAQEHIT